MTHRVGAQEGTSRDTVGFRVAMNADGVTRQVGADSIGVERVSADEEVEEEDVVDLVESV